MTGVTAWLAWTNWLTVSVLALILCVVVVTALRPRLPFVYVAAPMGAYTIYDLVQMFVTGQMRTRWARSWTRGCRWCS